MTKCLLFMAPIALIGLMATEAPAVPAAWSGSMARNIAAATADAKDAPLVLVRGGGRGGGGGFRGSGGGGYRGGGSVAGGGVNRGGYAGRGSWSGVAGSVNRGNFSSANVNRNVNVSGGGYYGPSWGGVAAGVAAGAVVGAAAASTPYYYPPAPAYPYPYNCPYPDYPNCGL